MKTWFENTFGINFYIPIFIVWAGLVLFTPVGLLVVYAYNAVMPFANEGTGWMASMVIGYAVSLLAPYLYIMVNSGLQTKATNGSVTFFICFLLFMPPILMEKDFSKYSISFGSNNDHRSYEKKWFINELPQETIDYLVSNREKINDAYKVLIEKRALCEDGYNEISDDLYKELKAKYKNSKLMREEMYIAGNPECLRPLYNDLRSVISEVRGGDKKLLEIDDYFFNEALQEARSDDLSGINTTHKGIWDTIKSYF
jgi:hypothetical protein